MVLHAIARRRYIQKHQLTFNFPLTLDEVTREALLRLQAKKAKEHVVLSRKPSEFPAGWHRLASANPTTWRIAYRQQWHTTRIAQGLPGLTYEELNATNAPLKKQCLYPIGRGRKIA